MASFNSLKSAIFDREERKLHYQAHIRGLNAYDRHKKFLNDYVKYYGKERPMDTKLPVKTDQDALREGYRFIRTEEDDMDTSWEQRLVKRYYNKLFKEYCIADMSKYKSGKIGLRWRTEKEVRSGKGQFICGNKHCDERNGLASFEVTGSEVDVLSYVCKMCRREVKIFKVNFSYFEAGENKQALVKLVACERCAEKLHYRRNKERELLESQQREDLKKKRGAHRSDEEGDGKDKNIDRSRKTSEHREIESSKRRRKRSGSVENSDEEVEGGKESKKKGKKASADQEDDENFEEFMEGMFL